MKMYTIVLLMLIGALSATAQGDAAWLFDFPSTTSRQAPRITKGLDGTLVVTYIERSGSDAKVFVVVSRDHGRTWTNPTSPTIVKYGSVGLQRQPHTVVGGDGTLHCLWENFWNGNQLSIFHSRSTDGGETWSHPAPIHDVRDGRLQEFSTIAAGRDGLVYAAFISADIDDLDGYQHLLMMRSTDAGATWVGPVRVDNFLQEGGACECCQPHVQVASDGTVGVAFRSNLKHQRDIYLTTSSDDGVSFSPPYLIQNGTWTIFGCPSTGPKIRFDQNGEVHAVWRDTRDDVSKALSYYARYQPGTRVIPRNVDITTPVASRSEYGDIAVSPEGDSICIALETTRGLQILRSNDGGQTFRSQIVDPFAVQAVWAHVVWTDEGLPLAVWQSTRGEYYDLRISRDQVTSVDELPSEGQLTATRTADGWNLQGDLPNDIGRSIQVFDLLGRTVGVASLQRGEPNRLVLDLSGQNRFLWARIGGRFVALP